MATKHELYQVPKKAIGNGTDQMIIEILKEVKSIPMNELRDELGKSKGYISDRVDQLESWGLVSRSENPENKNSVLVEINENALVV